MTPATGTVLGGRYRLDEQLGSGGMGTVWRARDETLARDVAVKTLRVEHGWAALPGTEYPEAVRRFRREARAAGVLDSAHVVPVYDLGASAECEGAAPVPYLVMQLVKGQSLAQRLAEESPLTVALTAAVGSQVCQALAAAHAVGVVHRDIKPSNIMLARGDTAKVVDFGIAKFLADITGNDITEPDGPAVGTLHYMAPERFRRGEPGAACDMYALGCVLHEMLTGSPPFSAQSAVALMRQHLDEAPVPVRDMRPGVPEALERLITRLLAKSPDERPSAVETGRALDEVLDAIASRNADHGRHTLPPPTAPRPRGSRFVPRGRRSRLGVLAAATAVTALVTALAVLPGRGADGTDDAQAGARRVIAVVGDFSGPGKDGAQTSYNSVRLALKQANRLTSPVTAVKYDDAGTADGAERLAQRLVTDERVVAVVGPVGNSVDDIMEKASKTYAQHGVVVVNPWQRQTGDLGATTYQLMGDEDVMDESIVDLLSRLDDTDAVKGVTFLSDGSDTSRTSTGRILGAASHAGFSFSSDSIDDDAPQLVGELMGEGHNVVVYIGGPQEFKELDAALDKARFKGLRLTQNAAMDGGYPVKAPWLAVRDFCAWNDRFDTDYEEAFGDTAESGGVEAYDATLALTAALREAPEQAGPEAGRDAVARAIGELSPKGRCYPDLRFGRDGYLIAPATFLDVFDTGETDLDPVADISSDVALDRARKLIRG